MAAMLTGFTFHWATYILLYSLDKPLQLVDGGLGIKPCPIPGRRASSISLATIIIWHLRSLGLFITYSHICTLPASCMTRGTAASVNPESTTFRPHKLTRLATFIPASVTDHHPLPPLTLSHNTCHPPRRPVLRSPLPPPPGLGSGFFLRLDQALAAGGLPYVAISQAALDWSHLSHLFITQRRESRSPVLLGLVRNKASFREKKRHWRVCESAVSLLGWCQWAGYRPVFKGLCRWGNLWTGPRS